jgi:hypothetical protein
LGRPSKYTDALAQLICERIASGDSLITVCNEEGMPHRHTVLKWLEEREGFRTIHARAREAQADVMDQRIMAVADGCTAETANADRVKIDAYKWRAARLAPKRYGDKLALTGADDAPPIQTKLRVEFVEATKREKD